MNLRAWAELLRLPALFTVPGDALAGAAATGLRPSRGTFLAIGSSLCLYEAGMALNDWADRAEDAVDRPHRPLPSGRVTPTAALTAAVALTAGGLALAARAGRPALATATALAGTVWAYDLGLKRTPAGPVAMAAARGLDLLLGATATAATTAARGPATAGARTSATVAARTAATTGARKPTIVAASTAATTGASTAAVTAASAGATRAGGTATGTGVTRALATAAAKGHHGSGPAAAARAARPGGAAARPGGAAARTTGAAVLSALPAAGTLAAHTLAVTAVSRHETQGGSTGAPLGALATTLALGHAVAYTPRPPAGRRTAATAALPGTTVALTAAYATTAARPYLHAALNPSPPLTQRAVGGGIRALIPLQAALAARSGSLGSALFTAALAPAARRFARKVSVT
ncbi:UbiA family prenyltransferase [Streptomyces aureoverticillatus]|uniref:UbiA family prenyltransferase n=1 Tax=Streptomyces aureoverticillatus TaxID=66871 RepID=UPI0013D99B6D|nr:UbiA family prenyltransferase [Streptomyces aureoverticillatus]QIB42582.1 UbiA family prenyltransferase [Streptomyces aureoverticillatus]